jgi:hypothetical protein
MVPKHNKLEGKAKLGSAFCVQCFLSVTSLYIVLVVLIV